MLKVTVTTVGAAWTMDGKHTGPGPWLGLIHECNRLTRGEMFRGASFETRNGNYVEVYPHAEVEMIGEGAQDQIVTVRSTNDNGARILRDAALVMGLRYTETEV